MKLECRRCHSNIVFEFTDICSDSIVVDRNREIRSKYRETEYLFDEFIYDYTKTVKSLIANLNGNIGWLSKLIGKRFTIRRTFTTEVVIIEIIDPSGSVYKSFEFITPEQPELCKNITYVNCPHCGFQRYFTVGEDVY